MPVFKNEDNGTWYVMARYVNWKGERRQKCKRGFATKKEAQEWERMFQLQNASDLDMSFEAFTELYIRDVKTRLKENTWLTKEHIIRTKILPYVDQCYHAHSVNYHYGNLVRKNDRNLPLYFHSTNSVCHHDQ